MAHLNCLPSRAAGVNYWFFSLAHLVMGVGISQMRDAAIQNRRQNERAKLWIFCEIVKWRQWRHAPRLTATAVITDSCHRFSNRWHVTDFKNIASDDQATLMVHRNSTNLACTFRFYVCLRLRDRNCCSAAGGNSSCHAPAPSYFEEMTHCRHQELHWKEPGNPNGRSKLRNLCLFKFTRSQLTHQRRLRGRWRLSEMAQTARSRRLKHRREWSRSIEILQTRKFMPTRSSKTSRKTFLLLQTTPLLTALRTVFFLLSLATAFFRWKIISRRPWPPPKNRDIHIVEVFW